MKSYTLILRGLFCFFVLTCMVLFPVCVAALSSPAQVASLPIPFVEQQGTQVHFTARTFGGSATVTPEGQIVYALSGTAGKNFILKESPVRVLSAPGIKGQGLLTARATVFHGKDSKKSYRMFESVNMGNITPGIGLTLRAYGANVEKLYTVQPGADPTAIRMKIEGGTLSVNEKGELMVLTAQGPVSFTAPVAYQEDPEGGRQPVQVAYNRLTVNEYGFNVGAYVRSRALVIDPLLASTYLGSSSADKAYDIALDDAGNVYVAGETDSTGFPVTDGSSLSGANTTDGFIVKFNADLREILAATFIGGTEWDTLESIAVENGKVYAAGRTSSDDCPTTAGAYNSVFAGQCDIYLCIFDDSLETLEAATYLGGSDSDQTPELVLSPDGDLFVAMITASLDFPMTSPEGKTPYQDELRHSKNYYSDVAIARLSGDLTTLKASTYLGGSGSTYGYGYENSPRIALDASGDVWVAGITEATDFPTTAGAFKQSVLYDGEAYVFLSRLDADLSDLEASTYLGHTHSLWAVALTPADNGNVYVAGRAYCDEAWPVTDDAYDTTYVNTAHKGFITLAKGDDLSELVASTYLGGIDNPYGSYPSSPICDMTLDSEGNVVVVGKTEAADFPTTEDAYDTTANVEYLAYSGLYAINSFFVARLEADLSDLLAGTYLGSRYFAEYPRLGLSLDDDDNVYLCGMTASTNFPTTDGAYDRSYSGGQYGRDSFVSKLDSNLSRDTFADLALSVDSDSLTVTEGGEFTYLLTVVNNGPDTAGSVTLTNALSDGVTFVSAQADQGTATCNASGVITCDFGSVASGAEVSVTIVGQAPESIGALSLDASVSAAQTDTNEANNAVSIAVTVTENLLDNEVDLDLSSDSDSVSVTLGGEITYELTVANNGPDAASSVVMTNTLPEGLTFVSATPDQGTAAHDAGIITCELGPIGASGEVSVVIVVQAPESIDDLILEASVNAAQTDTDETNNTLSIAVSITDEIIETVKGSSNCFINTLGL